MEWIRDITERFFVFVVSQIICVPFLKLPFQDLAHPQRGYDMDNAMNVRLESDENGKGQEIGAWFLQPLERRNKPLPRASDEQYVNVNDHPYLVDENETAILYLHGNSATRSQYHRRDLYRVFQKMGYFVLAIDYRGYGDSSWISPSQSSMVADGQAAFNWLSQRSHPNANIFIWGHSLGTGVTCKLGSILSERTIQEKKPAGYILESPFNRMEDEVKSFRISRLLTMFGLDVARLLSLADLSFDSSEWIKQIREPMLILHAEDDRVIPVRLAQKLQNEARERSQDVDMHVFDAHLRLGHKDIYLARDPVPLADIVTSFVNRVLRSKL